MGNYKLEHHWSCVNIAPPIVFETTVVETWKQHIGIRVIQSFDVGITTIGVEMVVALNIIVVKREVLIGSTTKLGNWLSGVLGVKNLNQNLALPKATIRVVGKPQMVTTTKVGCNSLA
jgi:hypothetical protein